MLLQGPSLPPAAWSHAPLDNQQHAHKPTTRRRAVAPLERFGRGQQKKSSPGLQGHPLTFTCARTCAGWSASWRARRLRWCHDWLPVQAVMSRYLWTACFPRCSLPAGKSLCRSVFFSLLLLLIWRLSGRAGIKQSSPQEHSGWGCHGV